MTITVFIRYEIDPFNTAAFEQYVRNWGQAIPRCGADLIGYYAPHEGSSTIGYAAYNIESLAAYRPIAPAWPPIRPGGRTTSLPARRNSSAARTACSCGWSRRRMHRWYGRDRGPLYDLASPERQGSVSD